MSPPPPPPPTTTCPPHTPPQQQQQPTILLVPGSCHTSASYSAVLPLLSTSSGRYRTATVELPSVAPFDPFATSAAGDTAAVREALSDLVERQGEDVVLVLHSYAGVPGCGAARGLSKAARRRRGLGGGVVGILAVAGILVEEGGTCLEHTGACVAEWSSYDPSTGLVQMTKSEDDIYYNGLSLEQLIMAHESLKPQAGAVFSTPAPAPAWSEPDYEGRLAYIRCGNDKCMLPELQDSMRLKTRVEWEVVEFAESGHCPMLGMVEETVSAIERLASKWSDL